jgi:hypothetical protein
MSTARREFLRQALAATAGSVLSTVLPASGPRAAEAGSPWRLATFRADVTPPLGHGCCGGWITPATAVDDPLEAIGLVLLGAGPPLVLCAVDWTGLCNQAHIAWRQALAQAVGTTPDRVAVHCVHQHNAPFACLDAQQLVRAAGDLPDILDVDFFHRCLDGVAQAAAAALPGARPLTQIASGQAQVQQVAGNRRVSRDASGRVLAMRGSSCRDARLRELPEGLIDPWLKTVAFYSGAEKIAACHYYATHPMSYYGDGRVSSDFAGLARKRRQADEPGCRHLYFTGCAGNVAAGKYNDGSPEMRPLLVQRMHDGIVRSEQDLQPAAIERIDWRTVELLPPVRSSFSAEALQAQIADKTASGAVRGRAAYMLAWLRRLEQKIPVVLAALQVNGIRLLHLPGECFVEYQLRAQQLQAELFVATAAYGDNGTWYVPVKDEYPLGGYEASVAFSDPEIDALLTAGMQQILAQPVCPGP